MFTLVLQSERVRKSRVKLKKNPYVKKMLTMAVFPGGISKGFCKTKETTVKKQRAKMATDVERVRGV